jgi:tetratricopeptide (TPR) repeat protein
MCDDALLAEAGARLGACLTNLDRNQEAMLHLEDAVARARSCGRLDILAVAITNLAFACSWEGDKHRSVALLREAVSVIERLSDRGWLVLALANLGDALIALGEWQEGRVHLEAALTLSEGLTSWVCAHARIYFARLLTRTGDMDGAVELLQETIPLAEQSGDLMALIDIQMHLAHFDIERGCAERAIQRLTLALDNTYPLRRSGVLVLLARAHLALGDAERAIQLASQARNEAARFAGVQRDALVVLGRAQTALGRWAEAEESLQAALRHAAFERDPQFEADVVLAMGELAAARGEPEIARTTFAEAIATYERLGAAAALERARAVAMRPAT